MSLIKKRPDWTTDLRQIAGSAVLSIMAGGLIITCYAGKASALPFMAGMACMGAGAAIGFLFGIPKTLQGSQNKNGGQSPLSQPPANGDIRIDSRLEDNTNLEQISDWLTKILIGASLVQFRELLAFFRDIAHHMAGDMPDGVRSESFAIFLMVYFLILGFLAGYLFTRLYLKGALSRADALKLEDVEIKVQKIKEMSTKLENVVSSDPNKGNFGGNSSANGRTLSAKVSILPDDSENFFIEMEVRAADPVNKPLTESVVFFLHPTFSPSTRWVKTENNVARLNCKSWGAFTVGVEIAGEGTRLELDLSELADAPEKFRSR